MPPLCLARFSSSRLRPVSIAVDLLCEIVFLGGDLPDDRFESLAIGLGRGDRDVELRDFVGQLRDSRFDLFDLLPAACLSPMAMPRVLVMAVWSAAMNLRLQRQRVFAAAGLADDLVHRVLRRRSRAAAASGAALRGGGQFGGRGIELREDRPALP